MLLVTRPVIRVQASQLISDYLNLNEGSSLKKIDLCFVMIIMVCLLKCGQVVSGKLA